MVLCQKLKAKSVSVSEKKSDAEYQNVVFLNKQVKDL